MQAYIEHVESAIEDLRQGKMIILTDHPDRENEADFIFPAETLTPDIMNFIIRHSSGIVCLSLFEEQLKQLDLPYMVPPHKNTSLCRTPFTVSIDARDHITTGVSAEDRVKTVQAAIGDKAKPEELVRPGHIFPLHAKKGGVLERTGHTEGAIDLVRLAGFKPAAVLCEVMNPDGTMTKGAQLTAFAKQHHLRILSIEDIISYRMLRENLIAEEISATLPLESYGSFTITIVKEKITGNEHVVLEKKSKTAATTLVRIHSACLTGDLLGSMRCDCHHQLHYSLQRMSKEGGILIYLNQEGRGIGLFNKIKAYALQEQGLDTIEANEKLGLPIDSRKYHIAANILRNRGVNNVSLLTNNPAKIEGLKKYGISQVEIAPIPVFCNEHNKDYLEVKKLKLHRTVGG
ncbi:MAG: ribBA [Gammaproteobacteria bacterium]|jgi:3,4-dihydroxy 2-butanone 4-phosphate synthase/GTP cyclohydrolase II|nr:ribBA [Gammaproteobacteria bacterium]